MYKLRDLLRRLPELPPGSAVVELGCWPGGWLQVLAEQVGPEGRVVGVDRRELEPLEDPVVLLELDFTAPEAPELVAEALGRPADALFCDAAPQLSGVREVDRAAIEELHEGALRVAETVLRPGGWLVIKGFPGPESDRFRSRLRARFARVTEARPEAKRSTSKEFYWLAMSPPASPDQRRRRHRNRKGKRP